MINKKAKSVAEIKLKGENCKMQSRRILGIIISIIMLLTSLPVNAAATGTPNVGSASEWAYDGIANALQKGFVPSEIQSNYQGFITRAEFCRMAVKYIEYITGMSIDNVMAEKGVARDWSAFTDTNDSIIFAANALGITSGTGNRKFTPNGQISREQAATMIRNVCMVLGADVDNSPNSGFADIQTASSWAVDSINFVRAYAIMTGTGGNNFNPKALYTREQGIVTFNNISPEAIPGIIPVVFAYGVANTQAWSAGNWAAVSSVQQFAYKNEGLAYAYVMDGNLEITTPSKQLSIGMRYPKLGDVISDVDGYFYIVWGRTGNNSTEQTIFVSKYTPEGIHVKTTGFVGESTMGQSGNTQHPFDAGNCSSAFGNGYLMVNYARTMYNGHQSNNVIGVRTSDMSPVNWNSVWDIPYTSHSFNQSVIWSKNAGGFVYADHGDAYGRGFIITSSAGKKLIFNFYLEANANYNMWIVNRTFAQMGGLAETSRGVALVGASAKSISEAAKTEKQNLFVQIFNPLASNISSSMFVGGTTRSGATSNNINDNNNSPLTPVTDYGVRWLTDYNDTNVIAPQVVAADDQLVILWSTDKDTFYMVLSASGDIITPATSLAGLPLNSFEPPVYHNGSVYWAAATNGRIRVCNIEIKPSATEPNPTPTWGAWSNWSTQYVAANSTTEVETKNQYRYRMRETTSSSSPTMSGWVYDMR